MQNAAVMDSETEVKLTVFYLLQYHCIYQGSLGYTDQTLRQPLLPLI